MTHDVLTDYRNYRSRFEYLIIKCFKGIPIRDTNKNVTVCPGGADACFNSVMTSKLLGLNPIEFKVKGCGMSNITSAVCPAWKAEGMYLIQIFIT